MSADTFDDLEDRLRSDLPRLADTLLALDVGADPADGDVLRGLDPSDTGGVRRWLVPSVAVAAVLLVLLGLALVLRAGDDRDARPVDVGPAPVQAGWAPMAASPLSAREAAVAVWTGTEVIVWGGRVGNLALSDGAAYDPTTDTWRMITPNSWGHPGAHAVWTGTEMVVLAKNGGAAYDPATDTWRDLPQRQSGGGSFVAPVWTGDHLIGIGVDVAVNDSDVRLTASRLAAGGAAWEDGGSTAIPYGVFEPLPDFSVVWTGTEAVAWDPAVSRGWAYDPSTGAWRELDPVRSVEGLPISLPVVVDQELYLVAGDLQPVTTRDPGSSLLRSTPDGWQAVGTFVTGLLAADAATVGVSGSAVVLSTSAPARAVDATSGAWTDIDPDQVVPGGSNRSVLWTGDELVIWGGADGSGQLTANGWRWHPGG